MDEIIRVQQSGPLAGEIQVEGAKNSALKLMAASLLLPGVTTLTNVPDIVDVAVMSEALSALGVVIEKPQPHTLTLDATELTSYRAPYEVVARMRASTAVLGPLVARSGHASVALPGGCNIGSRKIDMHISGLEVLGATCTIRHGYIEAQTPAGLHGTNVDLVFPSVGATENLIMAAVLAEGTTIVSNAAREPEISDLVDFLNAAGARIQGRGTTTLTIEGVSKLTPITHQVVGDRIEAGTFIVAACIAGGTLKVKGFDPDHLGIVLDKLEQTGAVIERHNNGVTVSSADRIIPVDVQTLPFPGFPTDMQAQMMAYLTQADGSSLITENVFENRFMFADEIGRMGADIRIEGHFALVKGNTTLSGAPVVAPDLRGGAALVLAGLIAEGSTEVSDITHVDRGYENFCDKLQSVGAKVERVTV
ncbi:MAG: UDP-N-acetylglucosamine 1-carboxyvinyltransferase [Actinomycetia bacterium]|nr:UDP-N-acetylglucosamine 1-carboxyvinyltransferase [Actinomycetes bacterium]